MGIFDGCLICSDMDGTLCVGTNVCRENIEAIKYFQKNGGRFTVSTGRNYDYIASKCDDYMITLNGTCIVECGSHRIVWEKRLDTQLCEDVINCAMKYSGHIARITLCSYERIENYDGGNVFSSNKIVIVTQSPDAVKDIRNDLEFINNGKYSMNQSWDTGLEIIPAFSGKGTCIDIFRKIFGGRVHTIVAVGDNENDLTMLERADISYAVENAIDCVKKIASRHTYAVDKGSIAGIVEELEINIKGSDKIDKN